ncbi:MAG: radical SAM protein [Candidatus Hydrothermarchaeales archaeon]
MMGVVAEKKMMLQSKGVRMTWELEKDLAKKFAGAESDYLSFFMDSTKTPVGVLNGLYTDGSPFEVKEVEDGYAIFEDEELFADITFIERPSFFDSTTSSGVKMGKMCKLVAPGFPIIYMSKGCVYWGEKQCKFCVVGYIDTKDEKEPMETAEVVDAGVREGAIKSHVALTSGALARDRGSDLMASAAKAIKEKVEIPISANVEPPRDLDSIDKLKEAGADSIYINLEVYDEAKRRDIMPGKSGFGIDYYDGAFERCLEVFEENQVASVMLAGLESDTTCLEGVEHLACLGVVPVVIPFYPTAHSKLNGMCPPSVDRMRKLYTEAADIIREYGLNPFATKAGFIKGGAIFALKEVMKDY